MALLSDTAEERARGSACAMRANGLRARVEHIRALSHNAQHAHHAEDQLWAEVLDAIAHGDCDDARMCARIALSTRSIPFDRRTA